MSIHRRLVSLLLMIALLPLPLACGGGGGGPTDPGSLIVFAPSQAPTANSIGLRTGNVSGDRLTLELFANEVEGVSFVSFILNHPDDLLTFDGASQGGFFGALGFLTVTQIPIVGGILILDVAVDDHSGSGVIMRLEFTAQQSGSGRIQIEDPEAQNVAGTSLDVTWIDGTVDVEL